MSTTQSSPVMILKSLSYKDTNWELQDLRLNVANLIVGKNSTGKSRTLQTIDLLVKMLTQQRDLNWGAEWDIEFTTDKSDSLRYQFSTSYSKKGVTFEKMYLNDREILNRHRDRNAEGASIANMLNSGRRETIFPPEDKLIIHTNRDVKKFPYLEEIAVWAQQSYGFKFGNISPFHLFNKQEYDLLTAVEDIPYLFESLNDKQGEVVREQLNSIGYEVLQISVEKRGDMPVIMVLERDIDKQIPHYKLSQGMFRSMSIIIYLNYLIGKRKPATIIVDDLCEGLDFERATKLGRIIFNECISNDIQIVATSNDMFLMEVVDLKYWIILSREGKRVSGISVGSNKELMEKFMFTGLSNFDLFSSDFLKNTVL
jgi:predicted ATP-dependent endonuclease of OLD family